jgi:hypothetical protein
MHVTADISVPLLAPSRNLENHVQSNVELSLTDLKVLDCMFFIDRNKCISEGILC